MFQHIHFGAGAFGLGFVLPLLRYSERSIVVTRDRREAAPTVSARNKTLASQKQYFIDVIDSEVGSNYKSISFDDFFFYDEFGASEGFEEAISPDLPTVITTSVKFLGAMNSLGPIFDQIVSRVSNDVYVIAMENDFSSTDISKFLDLSGRVQFVNTVVDRICSEVVVENIPRLGPSVIVRAEGFGRLWIPEQFSSLLKWMHQDNQMRVEEVSSIELAKINKLHFLNAAHVLIASSAHSQRNVMLNSYLSDDPKNMSLLEGILDELNEGVQLIVERQFGAKIARRNLEYLNDIKPKIQRRFCQTPDRVSRILARFKAPTVDDMVTTSDFLRSMSDKVVPPVSAYLGDKQAGPYHITISFLRLVEVIASRNFVNKSEYSYN